MTTPNPSADPLWRTALFTRDDCLLHTAPGGFPEKAERIQGIVRRFEERAAGVEVRRGEIQAERVDAAVRRVHDPRYVDRLRAATQRGDGLIDSADNPLSAGTWPAAVAAVSTALQAADWAFGGEEGRRHAFVAVRPPGHHATPEHAMGFCYFATISAVAQALLDGTAGAGKPLERVAILDFDVHHGNGTQDVFWRRGDVLFLSVHQHPFYPGTGLAGERGEGPGEGATINVPLPAGCGDAEYEDVFADTLLPALRTFEPQALLVSAGFDAWRGDPLGGMVISEDGFASFGRSLRGVADELCGGRLMSLLEGGYDIATLPRLVEAYLDGSKTD